MTSAFCKRVSGTALLSCAAILIAPPVQAQSATTGEVESAEDQGATIIVTAQKREQNLQDVPISILSFDKATLDRSGIKGIRDLQVIAPSLFVREGANVGTSAVINIRGVGTTGGNLGFESSVGFFVDGVFRARSGVAMGDLIDIERIEVLRGPQGTLFGKNTSAGSISVITTKPSFDLGGYAELTYGNYDALQLKAAMDLPLSDKLSLRVSGSGNWRDGYIDDEVKSIKYNNRDRWNLRAHALFKPSDTFSLLLSADWAESDENVYAPVRYRLSGREAADNLRFGPFVPEGPGFIVTDFDPDNPSTSLNEEVLGLIKDQGVSAHIDWELGPVTLTSITAYRYFDSLALDDSDFSYLDLLSRERAFSTTNFTHEMRLAGRVKEMPLFNDLDWIVGLFLSNEEIKTRDNIVVQSQLAGFLNSTLIQTGTGLLSDVTQETNSWALFAHGTLGITERLSLTGGLRFNHEEKFATANFNATAGPYAEIAGFLTSPYDFEDRWEGNVFNGNIGLEYQWTDDLMTYVKFVRGYKSGGINLDGLSNPAGRECVRASSPDADGPAGSCPLFPTGPLAPLLAVNNPIDPTFGPETAKLYEAGIRSQWFDRALTINLTGFLTDFSGFQLSAFNGLAFNIQNVAGVKADGVEVEITGRPVRGLNLSAALSYADVRYLDDPNNPADLRGNQLTNAAKWTTSFTANYELPLESLGLRAYARGEYFYQSRRSTASDLDPSKDQPGHDLINGRVGVMTTDRALELSIWCRNCDNTSYIQSAINAPLQGTARLGFLADPRQYGVTVNYKF